MATTQRTPEEIAAQIREERLERSPLDVELDMLPGPGADIGPVDLLLLAAHLISLYLVNADGADRKLLEKVIDKRDLFRRRAEEHLDKAGPKYGIFALTAELLDNALPTVARQLVHSDAEAVLVEVGGAMGVARTAAQHPPAQAAADLLAAQIQGRLHNVVIDALAESYLAGMGQGGEDA